MSVTNINNLTQNVIQVQANSNAFHLDAKLELKQGSGPLPAALEVYSTLLESHILPLRDESSLKSMQTLWIRLGLLYKDHPVNLKTSIWIRSSLKDTPKEYAERLQKIMTIFYTAKDFLRTQMDKYKYLSKTEELVVSLKIEHGIDIIDLTGFDGSTAWSYPPKMSAEECALLIAFTSFKAKRSSTICVTSQGAGFYGVVGDKPKAAILFLQRFLTHSDLKVQKLAQALIRQTQGDQLAKDTRNLPYCALSKEREEKFRFSWDSDIRQFFPSLKTVEETNDKFLKRFEGLSIFHYEGSVRPKEFEDWAQSLERLSQEVEQFSSLYGFFSRELSRIFASFPKKEKRDLLSLKKIYGEQTFLPTPVEFDQIRSIEKVAVIGEEQIPQESDFLSENLKTSKKVGGRASSKSSKNKKKRQVAFRFPESQVPSSSSSQSSSSTTQKASSFERNDPKEKEEASLPLVESHQIKASWKHSLGIQENTIRLLYATHVIRWFNSPLNTLESDEYRNQSVGSKAWALFVHTFPRFIDQFVGTQFSHKGEYDNLRTTQKDTVYSIPLEVRLEDNTIVRGLCQYAIDSRTNICYHRCIRKEHPDQFVQMFLNQKVWSQIDASELAVSDKAEKYKDEEQEYEVTYDSLLGLVSFVADNNIWKIFRVET
ncbi:MAG: hypothetical protein H7A42_07990 [Chlamydiales bacterium]|nr:hypothetical protein [Chlamydiales bacterium]